MTAGEKLRQLRKEEGLNQTELGELAQLGQSAIAHYERGARQMSADVRARLAKVLRIDPEALFDDPPPETPAAVAPGLAGPYFPVSEADGELPYAGLVPAGNWAEPLDTVDFLHVDPKFTRNAKRRSRRFVARVKGMSCWPLAIEDDKLIFDCEEKPEIGTFVYAQRRADNFCTVKELGFQEGRYVLIAPNPDADTPDPFDEWDAKAIVIGLERTGEMEISVLVEKGMRRRHFPAFPV